MRYGDVVIKPVPLLNITTTPRRAGKSLGFGKDYQIELNGQIILTGIEELESGTPLLFKRIQDLDDLFSEEGKLLLVDCGYVDPTGGDLSGVSQILSGYPQINDISFNYLGDNYTRRAEYTVQLSMLGLETATNPSGFNKKYSQDDTTPEYFLTSVVNGTGTGLDVLYYEDIVIDSWEESFDFNHRDTRHAEYFNNNFDQQFRRTPLVTDVNRKLAFTLKPSFDTLAAGGTGNYFEERNLTNYQKGVRLATGYLALFPISDEAEKNHFHDLFRDMVKYASESGSLQSDGDWYDHKISVSTDKNDLRFDITETATHLSEKTEGGVGRKYAVLHDEEYSVQQEGFNVTITVNGTIQGFEKNFGMNLTGLMAGLNTNDTVGFQSAIQEGGSGTGIGGEANHFSKIGQATDYFSGALGKVYASVSGYFKHLSGILYADYNCDGFVPNAINEQVPNKTFGMNPVEGTVTYSMAFDNRYESCFINDPCIISSSIEISDTNTTEIIAQQNIIGRGQGLGPILQATNAWSARVKSLSMELVGRPPTGCDTGAPLTSLEEFVPTGTVQNLLDAISGDLNSKYEQVFLQSDNSTYNPITGRYTRNVDWIYGNCTSNPSP